MARVKSGIPGLDELIEGGFVEGSSVLVAGGAGTGKTIFAMQYIYKGAEQYAEPGIYISMEEGATNIWWNMKNFRWNLTKYEQENMIKLYRVGMIKPSEFAEKFQDEIDKIKTMVSEMGAKRLVIDSTTAFGMWMGDVSNIRYSLFKLADELKDLKCTAVLTAETLGGRDQFSRFGVEEFVTDAIIALYFKPPQRIVFVKKMRGTRHDQRPHSYEITDSGITIDPREEVLWESLKD
jgi:KaiC/GvpD/RAD55 family RecA-like ATPase